MIWNPVSKSEVPIVPISQVFVPGTPHVPEAIFYLIERYPQLLPSLSSFEKSFVCSKHSSELRVDTPDSQAV